MKQFRKTLFAIGLLLAATCGHAQDDTQYVQLAVAGKNPPPGQAGGGPARLSLYWKFVAAGGQVKLYDLCNAQPDQPIGSATGTARSWVSSTGDQKATIDDTGKVTVTAAGALYASGNAIAPVGCDPKTRLPIGQPVLWSAQAPAVVPPVGPTGPTGYQLVEAARGKTLMVDVPVTPTKGRPATTEAIPAGVLRCTAAPVTQKSVQALTDSPALAREPQLWPGNLLQGKALEKGQFAPITARRAGGTLTLSGLTFDGADARYAVDIQGRLSEASVTDALNKLLSQKILRTQSNVSFIAQAVYSSDQMAFALGVDGRFSTVSFKTSLSVDTSGKKNTVLARFMQIYYTVDFEDPETTYSTFAAGREFDVDSDQIGADNPPLYIKQIAYGRTIYFLASSTESTSTIKAALEGAYGNKDAGNYIGASTSATYQSVMSNTSVSYFVMGGDAVESVQPIATADPTKMFDEVKKVIANQASAEVGASNRGLPVAYRISYLTNRQPASMGYATTYDQTDCTIIPTGYYSYVLEQTCVDDSVNVSLIDKVGAESPVVSMGAGFTGREVVTLDQFMPEKDEDVTLRILEYNIAGPWCSHFRFKRVFKNAETGDFETFYLQPSGELAAEEAEIRRDGGWLVGNQSDFRIRLNRARGTVQVLQR